MRNSFASYDNQFAHDNVYGHALALLNRHRPERARTNGPLLHLDIGCGFGRIAEPAVETLGTHYVGIDADGPGLRSLGERGLETHPGWLSSETQALELLRDAIGNRDIGYITLLDTLEHLHEGDGVLRAISRIAADHRAVVVISVPNVTHKDIGFKLATGLWDYTPSGLLDHTHVRLFAEPMLRRVTAAAGLHTIDIDDIVQVRSDQHFPDTHPLLTTGSAAHAFMDDLRSRIDAFGDVNQFVRAYAPGPVEDKLPFSLRDEKDRPFLTIVTRTQGRRLQSLAEVFTCLAGQTDTDFEVLVVGHKLDLQQQLGVEQAIVDTPKWLRDKIRLIRLYQGNRTRPLNLGFEEAQGSYIVCLDDDDLVMGHWVETFKTLAERRPGAMLRAVSVRQNTARVETAGQDAVRAEGKPEKIYRSYFDFHDQLRSNQSPNHSTAFPRGVFHDFKLRFDEDLPVMEDWDFMMRVASLVGVESSEEITSIYQWWLRGDSSRTDHTPVEWEQTYTRIVQKLDHDVVLFPRGTSAKLRTLAGENDRLRSRAEGADNKKLQKLEQIQHILDSTSWRVSAPLRLLGRLRGRAPLRGRDCYALDNDALDRLLVALQSSTSWQITAPLRRFRSAN